MLLTPGDNYPLSGTTLFVDDSDPSITYNGAWTASGGSLTASDKTYFPFGGAFHATQDRTASFTFQFIGTSVSVRGILSGTPLVPTFTLDGQSVSYQFASTSAAQMNYLWFTHDSLSAGNHNLTFTFLSNNADGPQFMLDYILYTPSFPTLASLKPGNSTSSSTSQSASATSTSTSTSTLNSTTSTLLSTSATSTSSLASSEPTSSSQSTPSHSTSTRVALIGAIVGAFAFIFLLFLTCFVFRKKIFPGLFATTKKRRMNPSNDPEVFSPNGPVSFPPGATEIAPYTEPYINNSIRSPAYGHHTVSSRDHLLIHSRSTTSSSMVETPPGSHYYGTNTTVSNRSFDIPDGPSQNSSRAQLIQGPGMVERYPPMPGQPFFSGSHSRHPSTVQSENPTSAPNIAEGSSAWHRNDANAAADPNVYSNPSTLGGSTSGSNNANRTFDIPAGPSQNSSRAQLIQGPGSMVEMYPSMPAQPFFGGSHSRHPSNVQEGNPTSTPNIAEGSSAWHRNDANASAAPTLYMNPSTLGGSASASNNANRAQLIVQGGIDDTEESDRPGVSFKKPSGAPKKSATLDTIHSSSSTDADVQRVQQLQGMVYELQKEINASGIVVTPAGAGMSPPPYELSRLRQSRIR
ncbi:hypothetical protein H0H93_009814 [Arthromyces matolae]|nr:hypothetical protein H0H93_009814 [Arthromyces matolae]